MSFLEKFGVGLSLAFLGLFVAAVIGWVKNIIQLINIGVGEITTVFVVKCIGIFVAPLGAIMGWIG